MIIKTIKHEIKMRRLRKKIDYVLSKMKEHEDDTDPSEWKAWANLGLLYLKLLSNESVNFINKFES